MSIATSKVQPRKELPIPYRIVFFGLLLFLALSGLARLFDHAAKIDMREKARWIINQRNEAYDFAILGSSRSYMGVDIFSLEKSLGQKGINLSLEGATYPEEYLALKLFLSHNRINHLILDLNLIDFDGSVLRSAFHAYEYLPDIANEDVFETLRDYFGCRAYLWKYVPFFKNAEFNTKLGLLQFYIWMKMQSGDNFGAEFDKKGSRLLPGGKQHGKVFKENLIGHSHKMAPTWNATSKKYFFKILELAKKRGIKVTMLSMPEYNSEKKKESGANEILSFYESVAHSNKLPVLRFDEDSICEDQTFFLDKAHLNRKGALLFSTNLADRLKDQIRITQPAPLKPPL